MKLPCILFLLFACLQPIWGQINPGYLQGLQFRNIGPANQGGRIVDIEADRNDFTHVFVATASGGVWKSENAGTTWTTVFDDYETASIGDIELDPNDSDIIWVGTGEANNRNSVSWGNGMYKSENGGESFRLMGLQNTHQIARVLVNPEDSEDICVCALGHLWGYSGDRGLFHSKNGGENWVKMTNGLPDDGKTGCIDLVRDTKDPQVLYAAFYHRLRQPWHFQSGGGEGGIYKSTNGGKTWRKLTVGLPAGPTGRIGLAIYEKDPKILMAIVEAERTDTLARPGSGIYRSENGGESWTYVNLYNNRPFYYSQIRINPHDDQRVYVLTTRFMVSEDGGKTLVNGSQDQEVHGDFHAQWLDPTHPDRYYLGADKGLSLTHDHGQHFQLIDNMPIGQFYRINYDMRDPYYVYGGYQDNGMYAVASFSRDARGILSDSNWKLHWGDGQDVAVNPFNWREMYTSMENGSYFEYDPMNHRISRISPGPKTTINYKEYLQDTITDKRSALRFNWSAPLIMSPHDPATLYVAGNYVFRSTDKGKSWKIISPDLTTNDSVKRKQGVSGGVTPDNTGAETHCSVTSLSISPISENVIWIGTDDGNVQVTSNAGSTWTNVRDAIPEVPEGIWTSRVEASHFHPGRAYVSFDGHRSDHFGTWIFVTDDFGVTWNRVTNGIANNEVIRVIREDLKNPDLLFAGSESGVWFSVDRGMNWQKFDSDLPTVSVYDLKIHPRDHDLIVGTHGRSIWIMDDISPLQQWNAHMGSNGIYLFDQKRATLWENVSKGGQRGHFLFAGENPPTIENTSSIPRAQFRNLAAITYYVGADQRDSLTLTIRNLAGNKSMTTKLPPEPGINRYFWDLEFDAAPYTDEQREYVHNLFQRILEDYDFSALRRMYSRFQNAHNGEDQRKATEPLTQGYLSFDVPEEYVMPRAGLGTYVVELSSSTSSMTTTVEIRDDPMNGSKE